MTERDEWARRVAEWRSSGLTSVASSEGKPFSAGGLRHWAHRLKAGPKRKALRVVRVERRFSAPRSAGPAGMCLFYKRLDRGTFRLPEAPVGPTSVAIDEHVLDDLLDGIEVQEKKTKALVPQTH